MTPWKKRKVTIDYSLCIICQTKSTKPVTKPGLDSLSNVITLSKERHECGDTSASAFVQRVGKISSQEILDNGGFYHRHCYAEFGNRAKRDRARARYNEAVMQGDSSISKRQPGRPSSVYTADEILTEERRLRSQSVAYNRDLCVICQHPGGVLRTVALLETGQSMLKVAERLEDKSFFLRLNTIPSAADAVANEVKYHLKCWSESKRKANKVQEEEVEEEPVIASVVSDIEIINAIECALNDPSQKVFDMNSINTTYRNMLFENGMPEHTIKPNYKRYLKELIRKNVPNASFVKNPNPSKPEQVCSEIAQGQAIDIALACSKQDSLEEMLRVAKTIRHELLSHQKWKFNGSFSTYEEPKLLSTLIKWILIGPNSVIDHEERFSSIQTTTSVVSQLIMQSVKTDRQVQYQPVNESNRGMRQVIETPLAVGLGLVLHQETRNKQLVQMLADMKLSIGYDKVMNIKHSIATAVKEKAVQNAGIYLPSVISPGKSVYFAIDNSDLQIDTPDGKNQLHSTAIAVYQPKDENYAPPTLQISRETRGEECNLQLYDTKYCPEPDRQNKTYYSYKEAALMVQVGQHKLLDCAYFLLKSSNILSATDLPTWSAFNSLVAEETPTTSFCVLPLFRGSPTDWSNLYSALFAADKVRVGKSTSGKTIVTLDLQLYSKCIQLQARDDINANYVFRMGELHVVFAALKAIGKFVDNSGLDNCFIESGIYGPATMEQIKGGKHMKRSIEAYFTLYIALFRLYLEKVLETNPEIERDIRTGYVNLAQKFEDCREKSKYEMQVVQQSMVKLLQETEFSSIQEQFDSQLSNQPKFLRNFMMMFENLLLFIRATRLCIWDLHLTSVELLAKSFFAFDLQNYARFTPVYLSQMYELQESDPETWSFLQQNFSVNKTKVAFSAIGPDHAIEHENRAMKVDGGIKGIANKTSTLERHFLVVSEMNQITEEFNAMFGIEKSTRQEHYQLTGGTQTRLAKNVKQLLDVFETHDVTFDKDENVYNLITKAVLEKSLATQFLNVHIEGERLMNVYVTERLLGSVSIWEPLKKRKLPTFRDNVKTAKVQLTDRVITLKEERRLLTRFMIASRERPEIDLPNYLGHYEFSVVPSSMFSRDGRMHLATDKSSILHEIEKITGCVDDTVVHNPDLRRVIMFDGMAVVNRVKKSDAMRTCKDFADAFVSLIMRDAEDFSQIRVVFDKYVDSSLKEMTRKKRTGGVTVRYKVNDETQLEHVSLKSFLSHVQTKNELTAYLSKKVAAACEDVGKEYVVVYHNHCESNTPVNDSLCRHEHEEADTLLILYAIDVARSNPFQELVVCSPDTDVFLLLIFFYKELCNHTTFRTGRGHSARDIDIGATYEALGEHRCKALLGFHSFTGCDQTAKFYGKSKLRCWKTFMDSPSDIIEAFSKLGDESVEFPSCVLDGLSSFVLDLYCKSRPKHVKDIPSLRWHLYMKLQVESEFLPPTPAALHLKIKRSHFITKIWRNANVAIPVLPSPEDFGWQVKNGTYEPITTDLPPVPGVVAELSFCRCKTGCSTLRCKCRKNEMTCTEMCFCDQCENRKDQRDELQIPDDDSDDDEDAV